jgi:hypothetical protein
MIQTLEALAAGRLRCVDITSDPRVVARRRLIEEVLPEGQILFNHSASLSLAMQAGLQIKKLGLPAGLGANLCSSGDMAHFIYATSMPEFFCCDQLRFFAQLDESRLGALMSFEEALMGAVEKRCDYGYWHNVYNDVFDEIAVFALFEASALGGRNIQVFEIEGVPGVYKITFSLARVRYAVHFIQITLETGVILPGSLGMIMIKAGQSSDGKGDTRKAYQLLETSIPNLHPGCLILADVPITHLLLGTPLFDLFENEPELLTLPLEFQPYIEDHYYGKCRLLYQLKG